MPKVCLKKETFEKNRAEPLPKAAVAPEKTAANGFFFLAVSNLRHFSSLKSQTWRFCSLKPHIWQSSSANPHPQFDSFDCKSISPFQSSSETKNHRNCLFASLPGAGGKTFSYVGDVKDVTSCESRLLCKPRLGILELCLPNLLSMNLWFTLIWFTIDQYWSYTITSYYIVFLRLENWTSLTEAHLQRKPLDDYQTQSNTIKQLNNRGYTGQPNSIQLHMEFPWNFLLPIMALAHFIHLISFDHEMPGRTLWQYSLDDCPKRVKFLEGNSQCERSDI